GTCSRPAWDHACSWSPQRGSSAAASRRPYPTTATCAGPRKELVEGQAYSSTSDSAAVVWFGKIIFHGISLTPGLWKTHDRQPCPLPSSADLPRSCAPEERGQGRRPAQ